MSETMTDQELQNDPTQDDESSAEEADDGVDDDSVGFDDDPDNDFFDDEEDDDGDDGEDEDVDSESQEGDEEEEEDEEDKASDDKKEDSKSDKDVKSDPADEFDDDLLEDAKAFGLSRKHAESFGTPENLRHVLGVMAANRQPVPAPQPQQQAPQNMQTGGDVHSAAGKPGTNASVDGHSGPEYAFKAKLDDFDPDFVGDLQGMNKHFASQIGPMQATLQSVIDYLNSTIQGQYYDTLDQAIDSLGEEYAPLVGRRSQSELKQGGTEFKNRQSIDKQVQQILQGYRAVGRPADLRKAVQQAAWVLFGEQINKQVKSKARAEIAAEVAKKTSQILQKPTHRHGKAQTRDEKADQVAEQGYRKAFGRR